MLGGGAFEAPEISLTGSFSGSIFGPMNVQDDPLVKNIKQPLKFYYVLLSLYDKNEYSPLEICRGFPKFVFTLLTRVRAIKVGSQNCFLFAANT